MAMPNTTINAPLPCRRHRRATRWALVVVAAVVLGACGGDSNSESANSERRDASQIETAINESTDRPEGTWSMLTWHKDNGSESSMGGRLFERMWTLTPTCDVGPCDIEVTAGGDSGTFTPQGEHVFEADDVLANAGFLLTWDDDAREYVIHDEGTNSCVFEDGHEIADGFTRVVASRLAFQPPVDGQPASLLGGRTESFEASDEAVAAGCDQPDIEYTVSGSPEGSFANQSDNIVGEYQTTGVVSTNDGNEHASWSNAGPGFSNSFGKWVIEGANGELTLTGIEGLTMDLSSEAPWSGTITSPPTECADLQTGEFYGEWTITESVTDMQIIGRTSTGAPILVTMWELLIPVSPESANVDCGVDDVTARVHLLPIDAIEAY